MITVNRVYVDAELNAEVNGSLFEDQVEIFKKILRYKQISIDSDSLEELTRRYVHPDHFYTIEPIQVELVPKYVAIARGSKYKREGETELRDPDTYIDGKPYYIDGQLARIVTEEEKPAFQMPTINIIGAPYGRRTSRQPAPFSGNIKAILKGDDEGIRLAVEEYARQNGLKLVPTQPEASASPQFQKCSFLQHQHTTATDHTVYQPAPVVDKPDKTATEILAGYGIEVKNVDSWFYEQAVKAVEHALRQQPTEWIPVTSDIPSPELFNHKEVDIKLCDGSVIVKTIPQFDGDFWSEVLYAFITLDRVTDWRKSLPEPPKP